ncbi:MAG: site-2 protease family protein [Kiloniellales bacterium]
MPDIEHFLQTLAIWALPLILGITLHEAAHAYAAKELGDPTAQERGRVSLNPLRHVDPFGTIVLPGLLLLLQAGIVFGYAKPVPVNPRRLRDPRWGMAWVALAGPASNLLQALVAVFLISLLPGLGQEPGGFLASMLIVMVYINCLLAILNMLPVPPLDGGRILVALLPPAAGAKLLAFSRKGVFLLLILFLVWPLLNRQLGLGFDPLSILITEPSLWLTHSLLSLSGR